MRVGGAGARDSGPGSGPGPVSGARAARVRMRLGRHSRPRQARGPGVGPLWHLRGMWRGTRQRGGRAVGAARHAALLQQRPLLRVRRPAGRRRCSTRLRVRRHAAFSCFDAVRQHQSNIASHVCASCAFIMYVCRTPKFSIYLLGRGFVVSWMVQHTVAPACTDR